jgi:hypothetical protein
MNHALAAFLRGLLLTFLVVLAVPASAQDPNTDIYGRWKIVEMTGGSDFNSKSDAEARALVGKWFYVSPERFEFNGKTCPNPHYKRSKEERGRYFIYEWGATSSDLSLPNPVTIIDTGCYFLYPQRKNRIIIAIDSVFYTAVRMPSRKARK